MSGSGAAPLFTPRTTKVKQTTGTLDAFWATRRGQSWRSADAVARAWPKAVDDAAKSATETLGLIHSGERSCVETLTTLLARIKATNTAVNACVELVDRTSLLEQATAVDAKVKAGEVLRPLEGLPIAVKNNVDIAGTSSTASTEALKDHRPNKSAGCWQRLADAGAILIAKTNMPELAGGIVGYSALHGHCWNPYNLHFSPGGSSSGSAAAIAAGMVPCAIGSDTSGSLRVPAELCGVVGMRPSQNRYPVDGCVPLAHVDTPGPMGQTVSDVALLDTVMAGEADAGLPEIPALSGIRVLTPLSTWRGGQQPGEAQGEELSPGCTAAMQLAVAALRASGAIVEDDPAFAEFDSKLISAQSCLYPYKGPANQRRLMDEYISGHENLVSAGVTTDVIMDKTHWSNPMLSFAFTQHGPVKEVAKYTKEEYEEYLKPHNLEKEQLEAAFEKYMSETGTSFILCPCSNAPPRPHAKEGGIAAYEAAVKPATFPTNMGIAAEFFMPRSCQNSKKMLDLGVPSIVLRTTATHDVEGCKFPVGVMIVGPPRSDRQLLGFGMALEKALQDHAATR